MLNRLAAVICFLPTIALAQSGGGLPRCEHDPMTNPGLQFQLDWPTYNTPNQCPQGMEPEYACRIAAYAAYWSAIWAANDAYRDAVCSCWAQGLPPNDPWGTCMMVAEQQWILAYEAARAAYESAIKACDCVVVDP